MPLQAPKPYNISGVKCWAQELVNFQHLIGVPACHEMQERKAIDLKFK